MKRTLVSDKDYDKKMSEFLKKNHEEYRTRALKIGFTKQFPEDLSKVVDREMIDMENDGDKIKFEVRLGKVMFGDRNQHHVSAIVTDCLLIPRTGPLAGFGQHGYIEENKLMNAAVIGMLRRHKLMVCDLVCSWPFVKVIVQKPTDAHIGCSRLSDQHQINLKTIANHLANKRKYEKGIEA